MRQRVQRERWEGQGEEGVGVEGQWVCDRAVSERRDNAFFMIIIFIRIVTVKPYT
jgi:hypothetical protein